MRPLLIYLILLIIFRIVSKRELAQATLFDVLIVLLISDDTSALGASVGAIVLVILSAGLNRITPRHRGACALLEGRPVLLIQYSDIDETTICPVPQTEAAFLQLMIRHHQGGVAMAQDTLRQIKRPEVTRLATAIVTGQQYEITVMEHMLAACGAQPLLPLQLMRMKYSSP